MVYLLSCYSISHSNCLFDNIQGQIIINKLKKDQVEEHAIKIREQYDILEQFLTTNTFMAGQYVGIRLYHAAVSHQLILVKISDDNC